MKTVRQALIDEVFYPIPESKVDNILIKRGVEPCDAFDYDMSNSKSYNGALADCLFSLIQAVSFSEADKSVSAPTSEDKKRIFSWMNDIYKSIGEEVKTNGSIPKIRVGDCL